ncbi:MAG: hypothetical protein JRH01_24200 [Deltaproteobacteria bacterium]|nr:hypothetical protein [Deltaproteobacteria bacterium]MBW2396935.1 hypothetical protein [Deltaproteobacteria bacterium]
MPRGEIRKTIARFLPVAMAVLLLVLACAPRDHHAFVEFFIDGYPPYMTQDERERVEAQQLAARVLLEEEARQKASRRYEPVRKIRRFTHGPFAAKECNRCHDLGASSGFRGARGGGAASGSSLVDLAEGGRLRFPVVELCVRCHTDYEPAELAKDGSFVHGPVGSGWCVVCHESHSASEPRLVRAAPAARLCGQCHLREDLLTFTAEHLPAEPEEGFPPLPSVDADAEPKQDDAKSPAPAFVQVAKDCTRCHDPHRGPTRSLLKEPRAPSPGREWDAGERVPQARAGP